MATAKTNNQAVAQAPVQQQVITQDVTLTPEEYQQILATRQAQAAAQTIAPQAAPVQQEAVQTQTAQPADPKAEKKAKFKKAGKAVLTVGAGALVGAGVTAAVYFITRDADAAEKAGDAALNIFIA